MKNYSKTFKNILVPVFLFLVTLFFVGKNLNKPFIGIHDWNGARYGNIARNYLRYGLFTYKFAQIENSGTVKPVDYIFYTHYPPLLPILISVSYKISGFSEQATRIVPLLATCGTIVLIFLIARIVFNWQAGIIASLLILSTPLVRYYGKNPVHEPLAIFFIFLALLGLTKVIKKDKKGWFLIFSGVILTSLTNWSGLFLALAITFAVFRLQYLKQIKFMWLIELILIILFFCLNKLTTGSFIGGSFYAAFLQRTNLAGSESFTNFSLFEFINRVRIWISTLYTLSLFVSSLFGVYLWLKKANKEKKRILLAVLLIGIYPFIIPNALFIHSYFVYYFLPLIALSSANLFYSIYIKNKLVYFLLILLLPVVYFERLSYLKALEKSSGDILAVKIAQELSLKIKNDSKTLIEPYPYATSRLPFFAFYSDMIITLDPNSDYNWLVTIDEKNGSYKILPK